MHRHALHLPWRVVTNYLGRIYIVDSRNNGKDTTSGRVCSLPQGKDGEGLATADEIVATMNATGGGYA